MDESEGQVLWIEFFLAYKYMNEFFKHSLPKDIKINSFDYFILLVLRGYNNLTFYEINSALPIDVKSLHTKISSLIERGFLEREFLKNGTSVINVKEETKIMIEKIRSIYWANIEGYAERDDIVKLSEDLFKFNKLMRSVLDLEIKEKTLQKKS